MTFPVWKCFWQKSPLVMASTTTEKWVSITTKLCSVCWQCFEPWQTVSRRPPLRPLPKWRCISFTLTVSKAIVSLYLKWLSLLGDAVQHWTMCTQAPGLYLMNKEKTVKVPVDFKDKDSTLLPYIQFYLSLGVCEWCNTRVMYKNLIPIYRSHSRRRWR